MLNLKTAELYIPILHSRPSKLNRTKNIATSRGDSLCSRNFLSLVIKNDNTYGIRLVHLIRKFKQRTVPKGVFRGGGIGPWPPLLDRQDCIFSIESEVGTRYFKSADDIGTDTLLKKIITVPITVQF